MLEIPRVSRRTFGRRLGGALAAVSLAGAARARAQDASPVASPVASPIAPPVASPAASPAASPVAGPAPDPGAPEYGPVQANSPYRFALLVPYPDEPFWQTIQQATVDRAAADGVTVDPVALDAFSVPRQIEQLDQAIAAGYHAILLGAIDAIGMTPGIDAANAAGVPVLAIDVEPAGGDLVSLVRTGDVAAGTLAGQTVATLIGGQGTVLNLAGDLDHPVAQARDAGFRAGLEPFPGIAIVAVDTSWERLRAQSATRRHLASPATPAPASPQASPEADDGDEVEVIVVDAVFAAHEQITLGALDAIRENGSREIVVGFGESTEILDAIRAGVLTAAIAEQPARIGAIAVDLMVRHLNGESVPPLVDSGVAVVTSGNVNQIARI